MDGVLTRGVAFLALAAALVSAGGEAAAGPVPAMPPSAATATVYAARVILPPAPASALVEGVKAKLRPGGFRIAPNVLDLSRRGSKLRFYVRGTPGATASLAIYDEAGGYVGTAGIAISPDGFGVVETGAAVLPGRELGSGRYRVLASGGGVSGTAPFLVARKVNR